MGHCESHQELREDLKEIKEDVKKLLAFRSYLLGAGMVLSGLVSFAVSVFTK